MGLLNGIKISNEGDEMEVRNTYLTLYMVMEKIYLWLGFVSMSGPLASEIFGAPDWVLILLFVLPFLFWVWVGAKEAMDRAAQPPIMVVSKDGISIEGRKTIAWESVGRLEAVRHRDDKIESKIWMRMEVWNAYGYRADFVEIEESEFDIDGVLTGARKCSMHYLGKGVKEKKRYVY